MSDPSLRVLTARLDDMEERYDQALKELRELRAEGAPAREIAAAQADVQEAAAKLKTADEEIAEAKATLKRHGYELDEDEDQPAPPEGADGAGAPRADGADTSAEDGHATDEKPAVQEPPRKPRPDAEPESEPHWSERKLWA